MALTLAVAACGGGNGVGETPSLLISEVSSNAAADDSAWFEVYNPTDHPVNLAGYQFRTGASDGTAILDPAQPKTFSLPEVTVPGHGLLVVAAAAKVTSWSKNSQQIVYVHDNYISPYWGSDGFVELVRGGTSADFVRFGNSTVAPLTAAAWSGSNVPALPSGQLAYGRSIVRPMPNGSISGNRRRASDWNLVNFATPAGRNDVAAGVVDSDGDGIPDSAKQPGGTYGGIDLYAMGARPGQRDIFLQIDFMSDPGDGRHDPMLRPRKEALQKVVNAFAHSSTSGKPYALHIDTGSLYSAQFSPADFNLGGGREVPFHPCLSVPSKFDPWGWSDPPPNCATIYDHKSTGFDIRRRLFFHYAVFGNSQQPDGSAGSSGIAELYGNDFIVTLGNMSTNGGTANFSTDTPAQEYELINTQASTLMHEFGHNLGLGHGGDDLYTNYKPNYVSIMNYLHQMTGIGASFSDGTAADRYLLQTQGALKYVKCDRPGGNPAGVTTITNSPCTANFKLDYSNGSSQPLNPSSLDEGFNIGRGSDPGAYADWNHNGAQDAGTYTRCLNPSNYAAPADCPLNKELTDFNDWDNLVLPFSRYYSGSNNGAALKTFNKTSRTSDRSPVQRHPRQWITETLPISKHH
ncbi:MAG TPA: lamin tail domain-containing protein [Burkholderiaceae bacterium]|nr:lamin tail domain-containing protein [Burkholderiaceae bacterium]